MISIPGYKVADQPYTKTGNFYFYPISKDHDAQEGIVKFVYAKNQKETRQLEHEYTIASAIEPDADWTIHPKNVIQLNDGIGLIYENFKALILEDFLQKKPLEVIPFLKLAIRLSDAVLLMHSKGIIHKDIKPENIFINPDTSEIKITGFGISSTLPSGQLPVMLEPELLEGTLSYMSPEQTGRMNRSIDYRTDMYSLGLTFYRMLVGRLPFDAKDASEWIFCHVAKKPQSPKSILSEIPEMVSEIIMKLISKLPEDRYQSMKGLKYDLEKCLDQLERTQIIEPFPLGQKDVLENFQVSQKMYGREAEMLDLQNAHKDILKTGIPELTLISGYSGIGKTALVNEFHQNIFSKRVFFVSGKFEQFKRDVPYLPIVEAFKALVQNILTEPDEIIAQWKEKILSAVGINGRIILDTIPLVEMVIGKQPSVPELPPTESRNRFEMVFQKFIGVFTKKEHSLILFLDDLQWADWASLNLIHQIIVNPENKYIFLIGAYRDNEVFPSHPLMLTLKEIQKTKAHVNEISLRPLSKENVGNLIEDTLKIGSGDVIKLAELIYEKTAGNPFFTIQFLKNLYQEDLLKFDLESSGWKWELDKIQARQYSDNVVDLMAGKIKSIESKTRNLLSIGACIGTSFHIDTLAAMVAEKDEEVVKELQEPLREGLIISYNSTIKFLHDRVQQAAYILLSEEKQTEVHLKLGRLLLANTPEEKMKDLFFEIVTHFNIGDLSQLDKEERIKVAGLNLLAAKKAKASNAYDAAIKFANAGIRLLSEKDWEDNYELMFKLHLEKAEFEYLNGNLTEAEQQIDFLSGKAITKIDKAAVCLVKMRVYLIKGEMSTVINTALEYLEIFNISIPLHPTREDTMDGYEKVNKNIGKRQIKDLINLPAMTDNEMKAVMEILSELHGPAFFSDPNLYFLNLSYMVNLSIQYGNATGSMLGYSAYGFALIVAFKKYEEGYDFSELGVTLVEKYRFLTFNASAIFYLGLVSLWRKGVNTSIDLLKRAFQNALEIGDVQTAGYSCDEHIEHLNLKGEKLDDILHEIEGYLDFVHKLKFIDVKTSLISQKVFALSMLGLTDNVSTFNSPDFSEQKIEKELQERISLVQCRYYILKLKARYIVGNYDEAFTSASRAKELLSYTFGLGEEVEFYLYYSLTLTAKYTSLSAEEKESYLEIVMHNLNLLKTWADLNPKNFYGKYALVSAEINRISDKNEDAIFSYEEAIKSAKENGFIIEEAISYEVASRFYKDRGFEKFYRLYLKEAKECYRRWGARGKVRQLEALYPFLREQEKSSSSATLGGIPTEQLDVISIYEASQIISGEIVLEQLIRKLMQIVIEQAGAQKAYLLLEREKQLLIVAAAMVNSEIDIKVFESFQKPDPKTIPINLVQYVKRTHEKTILQDATLSNKFSNDSYLITNHPKSIACLPFLKQERLMGIIYLENTIFTNAFTLDKISVLEILSSQAAISIENALLFKDLSMSKQRLQDIIDNSTAVIFAKKPDGRYLFVNLQFEKLFHVSKEKIIEMTDYEIFSKEAADQFSKNDKEVLQKRKSITYEEKVPHQDEIHYYIVVKFPLLDAEGVPYAVCGIATDITERKQKEEKIKQLNKDLEEKMQERIKALDELEISNIKLVRTNKDLDDFIYASSHELKQPTVNLEGLLSTIKDLKYSDEHQWNRVIDMMRASVEQSKKIITTLEALSKIQRIKSEDFRDINFSDLAENIIADKFHDVNAKIKMDFSGCETVHFSKQNLTTIISNLLSNAIKFRDPERTPEIFIKTQSENEYVLLTVKDNGLGISSDKIPAIFSMFKRMHAHTEGTGVGLYIIKRILENTGGKIEVESELGKGSTFKVYLKNFEKKV